MIEQAALELPFGHVWTECEEIEAVGILDQLLGKLGLGSGQGPFEVGDGLALAMVEIALDLVDQDVAAPAVLDGLTGVPKTLCRILHSLDQATLWPHGNRATTCCTISRSG